jgi:hypothetical protein
MATCVFLSEMTYWHGTYTYGVAAKYLTAQVEFRYKTYPRVSYNGSLTIYLIDPTGALVYLSN